MRKQEIIDHLTYKCGLQRSSAIKAVEGIISKISDALAQGEDVTLRGFGTLTVVRHNQRPAMDFRTGEQVMAPARRIVKFRLSKELKDRLNNGTVD